MKTKLKKLYPLKFWLTAVLPLALWMVIIFYLSSRQKIAVTESYVLSFIFFKTLHLIEYATLFSLFLRFFYLSNTNNKFLWALICTALYAASDELHQYFVPTREGRLRDVGIDIFGACIGWLIIKKIPLIKKVLLFDFNRK